MEFIVGKAYDKKINMNNNILYLKTATYKYINMKYINGYMMHVLDFYNFINMLKDIQIESGIRIYSENEQYIFVDDITCAEKLAEKLNSIIIIHIISKEG